MAYTQSRFSCSKGGYSLSLDKDLIHYLLIENKKVNTKKNDVEIKSMETMNYSNYLFSELKSFSVQNQNLNHNQK